MTAQSAIVLASASFHALNPCNVVTELAAGSEISFTDRGIHLDTFSYTYFVL
jgi:hypothetical protein